MFKRYRKTCRMQRLLYWFYLILSTKRYLCSCPYCLDSEEDRLFLNMSRMEEEDYLVKSYPKSWMDLPLVPPCLFEDLKAFFKVSFEWVGRDIWMTDLISLATCIIQMSTRLIRLNFIFTAHFHGDLLGHSNAMIPIFEWIFDFSLWFLPCIRMILATFEWPYFHLNDFGLYEWP